ncbi:MAG: exo-alpha-sialidase [Acidobacteria bacterium]|uniref:Exo-alpha-sialidase n=1 Tax=Candidatus Polarisedimenticola svalbardensis TaxID=2886004 RepID=A0A8J6XYW3_9BACT|nr:exo-alpha-sialidase [Candidatus Polarisedimenticola svalbardensis]
MLRRTFTSLVLLLISAAPVLAEVGSTIPTGGSSGMADIYILSQILEDPDPVTIWRRFNPDGPNRVVLNPDGEINGDGAPSMLVTSAPRIPLVAWSRNSAQGYDVVLSRFESGAWTTPEVLAGSLDDELDPALVLDPDTGDVHLFYWVDGSTPKVMHRQTDAALVVWSSAVQVSAASDASCRPAGVFHDGVLRVVYEVHDYGFNQTPRQVVLASWDGAAWIPEIMAISTYDDRMDPQVHSHNGTLWIDWIDDTGEAAWTGWNPATGWEPLQYETFNGQEEREFHVRGAIRALAIQ